MSRKENSIKNAKAILRLDVIYILTNFITRTIFIKVLSVEYLGLTGLFSNILSYLSLAELGVGTAITFSLFKPIAENATQKVKALMDLYRKIYRFIGIFIFVVGLSVIPFLPYIIKDYGAVENINILFIIYLLDSVSTYFFGYIQTLVYADQKKYYLNNFTVKKTLVVTFVKLAVLLITKNFFLYLSIQILIGICSNYILYVKINKMYPYLKEKDNVEPLDKEEKENILKNIKALMIHKIGTVAVFSTDNIVITAMLGLSVSGIYANYLIIIASVTKFSNMIFTSISSSIGNYNATKSNEQTCNLFKFVDFIGYCVFLFCTMCLLNLLNPFIRDIWIRDDFYIFSADIVFAICISFFLTGIRQSILMFKGSMGIYDPDKFKPIIESIVNLACSILLTLKFGFIGVILGTIISTVFTCLTVEPYVLYKYGFKMSSASYYKKLLYKFLVSAILISSSVWCCNHINIANVYINFVMYGIVTVAIFAIGIFIFFYRADELKKLVGMIKNTLEKKD